MKDFLSPFIPFRPGRALALAGALLATAGATLGQTPATFAAANYFTGTNSDPHGVAVGDVNGDGRPDIVTANFGTGTAGVLLGTGTGTFGPVTSYSTGGNGLPNGIAVADVNGDGRPDIVAANYNSGTGTVGVLLGQAGGGFAAVSTYSTGANSMPNDVAVGDVNGDGRPDIVTANSGTNTAGVLLGTGTGTFGAVSTYVTGAGSRPYGVAVGDVNGDGRPDIVTGNSGSSTAGVLLGTGTGTFGPVTLYSTGTGSQPNAVQLADVNGDGRPDIVTTNFLAAVVLLGQAGGGFAAATAYSAGPASGFLRLAVGDMNGDSRPDIVTANYNNSTVGVLLGQAGGGFAAVSTYSTGGAFSFPYGIALADVNGDGRPDIVTGNADAAGVLLNTTAATATPTLTSLNPTSGPVGTSVTLTGTNLTGTTSIAFTGAAGQKVVTSGFTVNAAGTQITGVVVPAGAQSGPVTVTAGGNTSAAGMAAVFWRANVVAAGGSHSVAVRADGTLWGWGYNNYGQAGAGTATSSAVPVQIGTGTNWVSVAAGNSHNLALRADGTIWAWGFNNGGQLGNGTTSTAPQPNPTQVGIGSSWVSVAAASNYSAAIRADGTMWMWGNIAVFAAGQTGNSFTAATPTPTQVGTATSWVTVACGTFHKAAVQADGTLWTWGYNGGGQLGDGTNNNSQAPTRAGTGTNWVSATAGFDHTAAVRTDGTLWAWGNNPSGQIGDGTSGNQRPSPVQIGTGTTWVSAVAGGSRTLAVQASGTLWAWGTNSLGQLGDGTTTQRTSPVQVGAATSWVSTAIGGGNHSLGEQSCRAIWAWGDNQYGQVGDGTTTQRNSPVQVYNPVSQLSSLSPASALPGTTVTATGTNLAGLTALTVNGASALASVANNTNTGFTFVVPTAATPGAGSVAATAGCNTASAAFTVLGVPSLTSLSPASGQVGSTLAINGSNLTGTTTITFAGSSGNTVTSGFTINGAGTQITGVVVPSGAATGNVTVTTGTGTSNGLTFTVTVPLAITSTSPAANARAASATSPVLVTFNQAMTSGSAAALKVFSQQRGGLRTGSSGTTTASGSTVNFAPTYAFRPGETVQATVTTAATAAAGGSLTAPRVLQFTAAAGVGPGTFAGGSDPAVGSGPSSVAVGDVDGDGDLDLVTTDYNNGAGSTLSVRLNTGSGTFSGGSNPAVGNGPFGAVLGDVDGDGDLDIVAANYSTTTVSVRLNNGGGTFTGGSDPNMGANSYSLALGDVDGDGDLDLLTANPVAGTVSVRLNNGSGTFAGTTNLSLGGTPNSVAVGDVDGDGDLDIVVASTTTNTVSVRLNNGIGAFSGGSDLTLSAAPYRVVVGDVDGDGDLDLLTANTFAATVSVRLNNGSGTFAGGSDLAMSSSPINIALGDVDGDGDLDFLATLQSATTVSVRLNNGSGTFAGGSNPVVGATPYAVAVGDVDGDGDLDLLATNYTPGTVSVRFNQSVIPALTSLSPASGALGSTVTLNGTNLTGATAIAFAGSSGNTVTTGFAVNGAGTQITGVVVPGGATTGNVTVTSPTGTSNGLTFTVAAAPLTIASVSPANGTRAAATASSVAATFGQAVSGTSTAALNVFSAQRGGLRSAGSGSTTASGSTVSFAPTYAWQPGETVQATLTTVATSGAGGALAAPRVWQFTTAVSGGTGTFAPGSDLAVGVAPFSVAAADVNNDGYPDVVSANATDNTVSVRLNNGSGAFAGSTSVPVGTRPFGVAAADVNGDGILDLLTANQLANTASICLGNGSGGFGAASSVAVGSGPWGVAAADVDGDGDLDLLTANHSTNTVSVRLNNGSGVFTGSTSVTVGSAPFCVVAADVDNDGDLDLATANEGSSTVSLRLNNSSGSFSGSTELPVGGSPQGVVAADLNGDGALDLATANHGGNNLSVLLNNGSGAFGAATAVSSGNYAVSVAAADVDGDGDLDLVSANFQANTVSVRFNNGSGGFSGTTSVPVGSGPTLLVTADVDQDGDLDLLTANQTANTVSVRLNQNATLPDLVVSTGTLVSPTAVAPGTYNIITVTNTGVAQLIGNTVVNTRVSVSGTLLTNCQPLTGAAFFVLASGATLGICDPDGLSLTPGTGAIRTSGIRSTSPGSSYIYNGTAAQATGNGLPAQALNLTISNQQPVTLTQPVRVKETLVMASAGNLVLNGQALTLLSDASGTALVVNSGSGVVQGSTGTMQRFIDASGNTGASGYRHYSTPVTGSTVADLGTGTFTPTLNTAYNTSTTPTAVQPFPTVFGYDETRLTSSTATGMSDFDKGWFSPASPTDPLAIGRGYTVQLGNAELVDFTGTFNTGPRTLGNLTRGSQADAGWHLVGNPYPAPLDWSTVSNGQLTGVNAAIYLYQSTGAYTGQYRSLVNGVGAGSSLIPAGQGFFMRASTPGTTGSITLNNANRATTFAGQPALQRGASDPRPRLRLSLGAGSQPATPATSVDEAFVYLEAGATTAFDGAYDAHKLANPSGYYLASASTDAAPQPLSVNGRPLLGAADEIIPLWLSAPAGAYTITATELANLTAPTSALTPYLRDALTGTLTNLSQQASYSLAVAPGAPYAGRFALVLRPASVLATTPGSLLDGALASLYPNPTATETTLSATGLPALGATLEAVLLDAVGREVGRYVLPVHQGGARQALPMAGLSSGLYLLRLSVRDAQDRPLGQLPAQRLVVR